MSSSNLTRIAFIEESTYGVTPGAGNFNTARFTSETLSGSPDTVESQQLRTDRMSSGQVVTGLKVEGDLSIELAKEDALDLFIASAMNSAWGTLALVTVDMSLNATAKTLTRAAGSFVTDGLVVGDFITLSGYVAAGNNVTVQLVAVAALTLTYVGPDGMTTEVGSGTTYKRADKISIGATKKSFSMEKAFLDLTTKAIIYKGMIASKLSLDVAHGALITGSVSFSGNSYSTADLAAEFITDGRTINAPATTNTLNGSVDMPFISSGATGTFGASDMAVKSVSLALDNNLTAQNVIGDVAPVDYSLGTAKIDVSLSAYLSDAAWSVLPKKLSQDPFQFGFMVKNAGGWYGFYIPAIQVSFDDPTAAGQNQDIMLDMKGMAKVGSSGESAITIYRS